VTLKVFDLLGREHATLVNQSMTSGEHTIVWNAENTPSGMYVYRIEVNNHVDSKKMLLLK